MTVSFPAIAPTTRSFSAPIYPVSTYRSQSGATSRRLWASVPSNAKLSLAFTNISDANAKLILECYASSKGSVIALTLPSQIFSGADAELATFMNQSSTAMAWHFADDNPPQVESVLPGRSSVSLELIASLDFS